MANILICVDGSSGSDHAVEQAIKYGLLKGNYVHLLRVVPESKVIPGGAAGAEYINALVDYNVEQAKEMLEKYEERIKNKCLNYSTRYIIGDPAKEILHYEEDNEIDMIVIGSRGLGKFSRTVMGSVSTKVSNNCKCSIFVSKEPHE
ncbi:MAG: universal stress protein [Tissierellia bacterium]|nr:universal stress protein [Tissierellia bacterium]